MACIGNITQESNTLQGFIEREREREGGGGGGFSPPRKSFPPPGFEEITANCIGHFV